MIAKFVSIGQWLFLPGFFVCNVPSPEVETSFAVNWVIAQVRPFSFETLESNQVNSYSNIFILLRIGFFVCSSVHSRPDVQPI